MTFKDLDGNVVDGYVFPENACVIYPNGDDGVSVLHPVSDCGLTLEAIIEKDVPKGAPHEVIDKSDLPTDRTFRNAWEFSE
tara:strand:- start:1115 stop:1357 length:243 start_codon:yes stop_codon:yes gene_type:complete